MPLIRSVEKLVDGLRITKSNGDVLTVTSADVPSIIKSRPIADIQQWVNDWVVAKGWFAICRINSVTPLDVDAVVSDSPMPFDPFSVIGGR